jgi:signal transduction histidine kinase
VTATAGRGTIASVEGRRELLRDGVPVLLLAALTTAGLVRVQGGHPDAGAVAISLLLWLPALFRRHRPLPAFAVTAVLVAVHWVPAGLDADALLPADVALFVVLVAVAERCTLGWAVAAAGVCELFALATLVGAQSSGPEHPVVPLAALTLAATLLGRNRRARSALLAGLRDRAERAERERDQQARVAVAEERTHIAREVHDVVSHNLSVMTALADGAGFAMRTEAGQQQARDAVAQVATTGREALAEMHRLLGVLRHGEEDGDDRDGDPAGGPPRRPAPGLSDLAALVEQVRGAGLPTTLTVTGPPAPLGTTAQLAVYRLAQEALTNTLTHAPDAGCATVTLSWTEHELAVTVRDDGRTPLVPADRLGHGLVGMRERIGAHGGSVTAGPAATGGWLVEASLPLHHSAAPA